MGLLELAPVVIGRSDLDSRCALGWPLRVVSGRAALSGSRPGAEPLVKTMFSLAQRRSYQGTLECQRDENRLGS